ncbi:MAG: spermidine/putrescine ABC transporter substrate-binding protein, partial [Anaerotignum sp.]|nr:spermidine/putrescine ABC transporter substrate-binding protein [Anaerotignum sp.]
MMKKFLALLLAGAMALSVAACGGGAEAPAEDTNAEASTELNIYMWQQYISDELIAAFEEENGCTINLSYMSDNADAINKLTAGGGEEYDLIMT